MIPRSNDWYQIPEGFSSTIGTHLKNSINIIEFEIIESLEIQ